MVLTLDQHVSVPILGSGQPMPDVRRHAIQNLHGVVQTPPPSPSRPPG